MPFSKPDQDINSIPYNAPLSFPEPSPQWKQSQSMKNMRKETLHVADVNLTGKNIIISGSNSGIGREAALAFARMGANVTLACREYVPEHEPHPSAVVEDCRLLASKHGHPDSEIEAWNLDLAHLASVEAFAERWLKTGRVLDILCNNAGIGSSTGGETVVKTRDGFEIYHQLWFQTWLTELQRRMLQHKEYRHITINGVHPGFVNSEIWNLKFDSWTTPFKVAFYKTVAHFFAINSQQGSLCILHGATSVTAGPDPKIQGVGVEGGKGGGRYFSRTREEEPMPHTGDPDCMNRVWRKANEELGLSNVLGVDHVKDGQIRAHL
ncbi:hypothetical protein EG328_001285 [Venturia inaequalis]|uniref:NAD(P)-binding protein n=1 Tax=Venturia inaequalis TaxID=5025 RepID=A0A8H3VJ62_VENIN|nr:hypothetical protein EG328_001285 [Venturia inaequalis]